MRTGTWSLVPLPPGRQAIGSKWVFRVKKNPDGSIQKYKARLVAKGFHQREGFDFSETFSPVVKPATIRLMLTVALSKEWQIRQCDFNNAFLNGDLDEEVFMLQPEGFISSDASLVCKLKKALYGLKQAPRAWFDKLRTTLQQFGFTNTHSDTSLFCLFSSDSVIYVLVYVDDILITGNNSAEISQLISNLHSKFALKDMGPLHYFLGIEATYSSAGTIHLNQSKYITDLLTKAGMDAAKSMPTPMISSHKLTASGGTTFANPSLYRSVVGGLQYATITRPDITYAVNRVCQFMQQPLESHWKAVKRILRYLSGTVSHGLTFHKNSDLRLLAFCDADWGSDLDDRKSTTGFCVYLGSNLISWSSKKQNVVSRSSTEAEFRSLASVMTELAWLQSLMLELHLPIAMPTVFCDNQGAVQLAANPVLHNRTKHFELDLFFVRDLVIQKKVSVQHIPSEDQIADTFTKPISSVQFHIFKDKLRVHPNAPLSLRGDVRESASQPSVTN